MIMKSIPTPSVYFDDGTAISLNPRVALNLSKTAVSRGKTLLRGIKTSNDLMADLEAGHCDLDTLGPLPEALDSLARDLRKAADVLNGTPVTGGGELVEQALMVQAQVSALKDALPDYDTPDCVGLVEDLRKASADCTDAAEIVRKRIGILDHDLRAAVGVALSDPHANQQEILAEYEPPKSWQFDLDQQSTKHIRIENGFAEIVTDHTPDVSAQIRNQAKSYLLGEGRADEVRRKAASADKRAILRDRAQEIWANV